MYDHEVREYMLVKRLGCPVCKVQIQQGDSLNPKVERNLKIFQTDNIMSFSELVQKLIADSTKSLQEKMIRGCQVFMPETVFFNRDGKVEFMTLMKDCYITMDKKNQESSQALNKIKPIIE